VDLAYSHHWAGVVCRSCISIFNELRDFQDQLRTNNLALLYWAVPTTINNPADEKYGHKIFPISLDFESIHTATLISLSWGVMLQLLSNIIRLYDQLFGSLEDPPSLQSILQQKVQIPGESRATLSQEESAISQTLSMSGLKTEADRISRYCCQGIQYFHRTEMGTFGLQLTCYARWLLKQYFRKLPQYEHELEWALNIPKMSGQGFQSGIDLMDLGIEQV
jgi:hypothetical protein